MALKVLFLCFLVTDLFSPLTNASLHSYQDVFPEMLQYFEETVVHPGETVTLTCKAKGSPIPEIEWTRDNMEIDTNTNTVTKTNIDTFNNVVSQLIISNIKSEDGGVFKCTATNKEGKCEHRARIHVYGKPSVRKNIKVNVIAEESALIDCPYVGYPIKSISWQQDGMKIPRNKQQIPYKNGTLIIQDVQRRTDAGLYQCIVEDFEGNTATGDIELIIMVLPKISPFWFQEEQIREGTRARIQCVVNEGESPLDIKWLKDNKPLSSDLGVTIRDVDEFSSVLLINAIAPRHNGNYTCVARNIAGRTSHTAALFVNAPPKLLPFAFQDDQFFRGMRAYIVCAISQGDLPIRFDWLKDNHPIPPSLGVTTRTIDEHATSLSIDSVSSDHTGNYTCVATNAAAKTSHTAQLLVHGIIPRIIPFKFPSNILEGSPVRVTCVVDQGDLPIQFKWLRNDVDVSTLNEVSTRTIDDYSSLLTISNVNPMHSGNYTCLAMNAAATVNHTTPLVVHVPPKVVPFSFQDDHYLEGMLVRVSCVVSRGDLPLEITWLKDGQTIPVDLSVNIRDFDDYSSVLSIDPISVKHSGDYTCSAKNHAGIATHTARLVVNVPPEWEITPSDVELSVGHYVMINCRAKGYPQPQISWERSLGSDVEDRSFMKLQNTDNIDVFSNGSLSFKHISKSDEGYYYCIASNNVGKPLNMAITIKVNAAPEFRTKNEKIQVKKGDSVKISCTADGDKPMRYTWAVNNKSLERWFSKERIKFNNHEHGEIKESFSEITILWVEERDSVTFSCLAENSIGKDEKQIQLIVQSVPEAPEFDKPVRVYNQSVQLSWNLPFNGNSAIRKYFIELKKENDNWNEYQSSLIAVESKINSKIISDLLPSTTYVFRIRAENAIGNGTYSRETTVKTEEIAPSGSPRNIQVEAKDSTTIRITWNAPKKTSRNGAIQGYNIGYKPNGTYEDYKFFQLEVPEDYTEALIYQLTDLEMYTSYSIVVEAYNSKGPGPRSEPVIAMTAEGVPTEPPQNIRCSTLSSKSIYVLWDPPRPETMNGILRGYRVIYKATQEVYEALEKYKIVQVPKISLQDLQINTNYTIQVVAFTNAGDGAKSRTIHCLTFEDVPEAPLHIKVLQSAPGSVVVSWKPSKKINTAITHFSVYYKALREGQQIDLNTQQMEEFSRDATVQQSQVDSNFVEVVGLRKNRNYAFWVTANSVLGESPMSTLVSQTAQTHSVVPAKIASFDDTIKTPWKEDIVMPCKAIGIPTPNTKWSLGSKPLSEKDHLIFRPDGSLMITKATGEDSGNYTCVVYNDYGTDDITYNVIVQVPPSSPKVEIISKTKSSIQIQWQYTSSGGDPVRGYRLYYKKASEHWSTIDISPEHRIYTLDNLPCSTTYQLYMEAFNSIGTSAGSDIITVETGGAGEVPSKDVLIKESSTFATLYLDSWPTIGCPVKSFSVEYRATSSKEWTLVGSNISPMDKKITISELNPATWYILRLKVLTNEGSSIHEYKFSTLTLTGDSIAPEVFEEVKPVYIFHLDPWIFIPAVVLLIVVIIAAVVVVVVAKRSNGSLGAPSDMDLSLATNQMNAWVRNSKGFPVDYGYSQRYSTLSGRSTKDPSPYATSRMIDCYSDGAPGPSGNVTVLSSSGNSQTLKHKKSAHPLTGLRDTLNKSEPNFAGSSYMQDTLRAYPIDVEQNDTTIIDQYDPPPKAHMMKNDLSARPTSFPIEDGDPLLNH